MATRYYTIELECGCLISLDGGGGLIPCCYPGYGATKEQIEKCERAWEKYRNSEEYEEHQRETVERNKW